MSSTRKINNFALFKTHASPHKHPGNNERLDTRKKEMRYYKWEFKLNYVKPKPKGNIWEVQRVTEYLQQDKEKRIYKILLS